MIDYADHPCTCGHYEASHRRALLSCRVKGCKCERFLNRHYLDWLKWVIRNDVAMLAKLRRELARRLKAKARARAFEGSAKAARAARRRAS